MCIEDVQYASYLMDHKHYGNSTVVSLTVSFARCLYCMHAASGGIIVTLTQQNRFVCQYLSKWMH